MSTQYPPPPDAKTYPPVAQSAYPNGPMATGVPAVGASYCNVPLHGGGKGCDCGPIQMEPQAVPPVSVSPQNWGEVQRMVNETLKKHGNNFLTMYAVFFVGIFVFVGASMGIQFGLKDVSIAVVVIARIVPIFVLLGLFYFFIFRAKAKLEGSIKTLSDGMLVSYGVKAEFHFSWSKHGRHSISFSLLPGAATIPSNMASRNEDPEAGLLHNQQAYPSQQQAPIELPMFDR